MLPGKYLFLLFKWRLLPDVSSRELQVVQGDIFEGFLAGHERRRQVRALVGRIKRSVVIICRCFTRRIYLTGIIIQGVH